MAGYMLLALLAFTGAAMAEDRQVELVFHPPGVIRQGDTITISCTVTGGKLGVFDVVNVMRGSGDSDAIIMSNGKLKQPFVDVSPQKYSVEDVDNGFKVTIENVQGSDGGDVGCIYMDSATKTNIQAREVLAVYVPVSSVTLEQLTEGGDYQPVEEGAQVTLRKGSEDGLRCVVKVEGSDPDFTPTVTFTVGDKDMTKDAIVGSPVVESQDEMVDQLRQLSYSATYTYQSAAPDTALNGKPVSCQATMPEHDPVAAAAQLQVTFAPELSCSADTYAKLGQGEVRITCKGRMNPAPVDSQWSWGAEGNTTTLKSSEELEGIVAEKLQEDESSDGYEFSLVFHKTESHHFGSYQFKVDNGQDEPLTKTLKLIEVEEPKPEPLSTKAPRPDPKPESSKETSDPILNGASRMSAIVGSLLPAAILLILHL